MNPIDIPEVPRQELTAEACAVLAYRVMADDPLPLEDLADLLKTSRAQVAQLEERLYRQFWARADAAFPMEQLWAGGDDVDFATWIRRSLKRWQVPQAELARQVGVTRAAVSAWVNGVAQPNASTLREIEKILGTRFSDARDEE